MTNRLAAPLPNRLIWLQTVSLEDLLHQFLAERLVNRPEHNNMR
jgi:hypothetical protein